MNKETVNNPFLLVNFSKNDYTSADKNNTYKEETFNVTNTSIPRTAGLRNMTLALQGGAEIQTVNLCLWSSMGNSFQMSLWNLEKEGHPWRRIPYVTKIHHRHHQYHHHYKHCAHNDFQRLLQNTRCKMVNNWITIDSQAVKEMNPTLTLLIMTMTVVTVMVKCISDHPKHCALNLRFGLL